MRRAAVLVDNRGFTVMEVLVAATVFIVGLSITIGVLNSSLVRLSTRELILASSAAAEVLVCAENQCDFRTIDTVVSRGGISFRLHMQSVVIGNLTSVRLRVFRLSTDKLILDLYDEYQLREK